MRCERAAETRTSARTPASRRSKRFVAVRRTLPAFLLLTILGSQVSLGPTAAGPQHVATSAELPAAFAKTYPTSIDELSAIENHVARLAARVKPATVAVKVGQAFGSGVVVSSDGYVLTAGHVSGPPNRRAEVIFSDGRRYRARTLGQNRSADSGLIKIESDRDDWAFVDMAPKDGLRASDWCLALGHPGGIQPGRDAVLRLGRILHVGDDLIQTDCELVGGDSGGPLFDMRGRVVGINSRIAEQADMNFHVPVALYVDEWDRLAASESYMVHSGAYLGVKGARGPEGFGLQVTVVETGTAAERAGLEVGDVILKFQDERVNSIDDLIELVGMEQPGSRIGMMVLREGRPVALRARLGERDRD